MPGTDGADLVLIGLGGVARRFWRLLRDERLRLPGATRVIGIATATHGCALATDGLDPEIAKGPIRPRDSLSARHDRTTGPPPASALDLLARLAHLRTAGRECRRRLVVVETTPLGLDGGQPGVDHVRAAIDIGADVITANKGPAAFAYRQLRDLASAAGVAFRFEGAVLDGLPLFSLIRETLPAVGIRGVRGVLNTTTNHVLSAMGSGRTLDDAIREMQDAGIAEADPTSDIDGWDAAAKVAVVANVALDADLTPHDVEREGLRAVDPATVRAARARGDAVKLVATAYRREGRVHATVGPMALPADDPLARLSGTAKGLVIDTDRLGAIVISKTSSHVAHTAYALLADLISIQRLGARDEVRALSSRAPSPLNL